MTMYWHTTIAAARQELSNTVYNRPYKSCSLTSNSSSNNGLVILQGNNVQIVSYDIIEYSSQFMNC